MPSVTAARRRGTWADNVEDYYVAELATAGRDAAYRRITRSVLLKIAACGWKRLPNITRDSFVRYL